MHFREIREFPPPQNKQKNKKKSVQNHQIHCVNRNNSFCSNAHTKAALETKTETKNQAREHKKERNPKAQGSATTGAQGDLNISRYPILQQRGVYGDCTCGRGLLGRSSKFGQRNYLVKYLVPVHAKP